MLHKRSKAMLRLVLWTVDFEDSIRAFWHGFFRGFHWNNISQPPGSRKKTARHHHRTGRSKRWSLAPFQNRPGNCDFFEATRGFFRDQGGKEKAKVCVCVFSRSLFLLFWTSVPGAQPFACFWQRSHHSDPHVDPLRLDPWIHDIPIHESRQV